MSLKRVSDWMSVDYGSSGALIGFVLSLIVFALLMGLAIMIDRDDRAVPMWCSTCLLRMAALLTLTFGLGMGYLLGRAIGG